MSSLKCNLNRNAVTCANFNELYKDFNIPACHHKTIHTSVGESSQSGLAGRLQCKRTFFAMYIFLEE